MKPKRGERYFNKQGEYCVIKSVYRDVIKLQVCGKKARPETWTWEHFRSPSIGRFLRIPYPKINRTNIARHLLEYQLNITGKTTNDTKKNLHWFNEWTISEIEFDFLKRYAIPLLKKTFKFNTKKANETFDWWNMQFGLKIKK